MTKKRFRPPAATRRVLLFNKPFRVLSQFTGPPDRSTLADYIDIPHIYAAGRLDFDSEGLLVLTDDGKLQAAIADPEHRRIKTYWVQVEGEPNDSALAALRGGVDIGGYVTRPCRAQPMNEPLDLWPRNPPVRHRLTVPTSWLEIQISEGKNRQVRKMTARVGLPTLRLIRAAIDNWTLDGLQPGQYRWTTLP